MTTLIQDIYIEERRQEMLTELAANGYPTAHPDNWTYEQVKEFYLEVKWNPINGYRHGRGASRVTIFWLPKCE